MASDEDRQYLAARERRLAERGLGKDAKKARQIAREASDEERIVCPNLKCSYTGAPRKTPRAEPLAGCLLLLFGVLPGLLYMMLRAGYTYSCPKCGLQIRSD